LAIIPDRYRKETTFFQLSAFPFSFLYFLYSNPYQHWPSTHVTLHLVALHLALLFQVGRHHDRLGVPLSLKVTFYLCEDCTFSLPRPYYHIRSKWLTQNAYHTALHRGRIPNLSLNANLCRLLSFSFPGSLDTWYGGRAKGYVVKRRIRI